MSKFRNIFLLLLLITININASSDSIITIVDKINMNVNHIISQPEELNNRLTPNLNKNDENNKEKRGGYRVQVYSNNGLRSKAEAQARASLINEIFSEYPSYVIYNAPFWRVKIGDFRTMQDAEDFAKELKKAYPQFSKEISIVRDRINNN